MERNNVYNYLVWHLLQPLAIFLIWMGVVVGWLWYRRRETPKCLLVVTIPYVLLFLFSMPAVAYVLRGSLEWRYPALSQRPPDTDAIVVLSGGFYPADGPRTQPELDEETQGRCLCALELYRQGKPCPILMSGGPSSDPTWPTYAEVMRDFIIRLGANPADILVENQSRTTYENAVESRLLLEKNHLRKSVLVTSSYHLPRAVACFRKQGIEVIPCGCQYRATPEDKSRYGFVPNSTALEESRRAWHEWIGIAYYWLRGRI
jgi:uncharacterized SAM-binding protein YcdF (DUF218 family)